MGLMEDVGVLMLWSWSEVWGWAWDVVVLTLERMVTLVVVLVCVLEGTMASVVERLDGWCITGSAIGSGIPSAAFCNLPSFLSSLNRPPSQCQIQSQIAL